MKVLGLIPARGGSKGLPGKNVRELGGKPMIQWSIDAALASRCISDVVVTTDDLSIADAALLGGAKVPFMRPENIATDQATTVDVVMHSLAQLSKYDYLVLLQPTSPLRSTRDIDHAFEMMLSQGAESCVSICESSKHPLWMFEKKKDGRLSRYVDKEIPSQRQLLSSVYVLNGAVYIVNVDWFMSNQCFINEETIGYAMPAERSIDVDSLHDFKIAEFLISEHCK